MEWPLVLKTGFGNVHPMGRWDHRGAVLIAEACNSDRWQAVIEYVETLDWDDTTAN